MGIYARYKNKEGGLLQLVVLLESSSPKKQQQLIQFGNQHDKLYTRKALQHVILFEDLSGLPDVELAELMHVLQPNIIAAAIYKETQEVRDVFFKQLEAPKAAQTLEAIETCKQVKTLSTGSKIRMIQAARTLCQAGLILGSKKIFF